jgi:hypothetical protein
MCVSVSKGRSLRFISLSARIRGRFKRLSAHSGADAAGFS